MIRRRANGDNAGFTLLEVLVALGIAALVFITVQRSQGQMVQVLDRSRMGVLANLVATNHLQELRAIKWWPEDNEVPVYEEAFSLGGFDWLMTRRFELTLIDHVVRVEIDVALEDEVGERTRAALTGFLLENQRRNN